MLAVTNHSLHSAFRTPPSRMQSSYIVMSVSRSEASRCCRLFCCTLLARPNDLSKIRLFPNPVGRLISMSWPDKICWNASRCWGRMLMLSLLRNCRGVRIRSSRSIAKPLFSHLRIRQPQAMNSINMICVSTIRLVRCYATPVTVAGPSFPF